MRLAMYVSSTLPVDPPRTEPGRAAVLLAEKNNIRWNHHSATYSVCPLTCMYKLKHSQVMSHVHIYRWVYGAVGDLFSAEWKD